jgi:hypothetical protein
MKTNLVALTLLCIAFCASARAAPDCNKQQLAADESLSSYLHDYAASCLDDNLKQQLESYDLPVAVTPATGAHLVRMKPAWDDLATRFGALRDDPGVGANMKIVYGELRARATATARDLVAVIQGDSAPDVSPLRQDGWKIQSSLILLEVPTIVGVILPDVDVETALDNDCPVGAGSLCAHTLKQSRELMRLWKLADRMTLNVSSATFSSIKAEIVRKDDLWNTYLYDSKPMLPFDFVLTDFFTGGWSKSDQFPSGFREPPKTQWFLLHPTLGVEYTSDALDGEQMKPMLFVELIGVNRWNPENRWLDAPLLRYLSGAALVASYADRAGIKDSGYGLLLTFSNIYSVGVARYGEETGLFLSLDFANLVRNKYKPRYEKFKEDIQQFKSQLP